MCVKLYGIFLHRRKFCLWETHLHQLMWVSSLVSTVVLRQEHSCYKQGDGKGIEIKWWVTISLFFSEKLVSSQPAQPAGLLIWGTANFCLDIMSLFWWDLSGNRMFMLKNKMKMWLQELPKWKIISLMEEGSAEPPLSQHQLKWKLLTGRGLQIQY